MRHHLVLATLFLIATSASGQTLRLEGQVLGLPLVIEAVGTGEVIATAMRAAYDEAVDLERYVDPVRGIIPQLNAAAGDGLRKVDERLIALLARTIFICDWSLGSHGPLGGWLYEGWGLRTPSQNILTGDDLRLAIRRASCDGIGIDLEKHLVVLAPDRKLELWGFARGFVVDRASVVLFEQGAENATVRLGSIQRGTGPGPNGDGWPVTVPADREFPVDLITEGFSLHDQSFALASGSEGSLNVSSTSYPPYIDQLSGKPADGVIAVGVVTDLAIDAQAVATTLFAIGNRAGMSLASRLEPKPSARWLLGGDTSSPLIADYRWSTLKLPQ